ncbi:hypothetical protein HETIRDRAFT_448225 [Heterobasidion irregulare TC 32-1]|uniref:Uncharacterized protein n=1 Tax=Heterobasidion irregulare (strain TC 32-1) TaxID=747525 RepID=W4KQ51_HETIT|nr:uncharacterized protein HETIRDRAFT_448225 [Heterobasidion irregulare TC 32-1]ETW87809.1 hypothetical protein HETIRDRAFT_448225 [Heterobasidion irregulare TC 32-1]
MQYFAFHLRISLTIVLRDTISGRLWESQKRVPSYPGSLCRHAATRVPSEGAKLLLQQDIGFAAVDQHHRALSPASRCSKTVRCVMPAAQRLPLLLFALAHNASMGKDRLALFVIVDHDFWGYSEYERSVAGSSAELQPALPICRSDAVMMLVIECCMLSMISYDITRAGQSPAWPGPEWPDDPDGPDGPDADDEEERSAIGLDEEWASSDADTMCAGLAHQKRVDA